MTVSMTVSLSLIISLILYMPLSLSLSHSVCRSVCRSVFGTVCCRSVCQSGAHATVSSPVGVDPPDLAYSRPCGFHRPVGCGGGVVRTPAMSVVRTRECECSRALLLGRAPTIWAGYSHLADYIGRRSKWQRHQ